MRITKKGFGWVIAVTTAAALATAAAGVPTSGGEKTIEFKQALLRVEINATDGDAGVQIDMDHEPWNRFRLLDPRGRVLVDVKNKGVLRSYGLTELFSESSEPSFDELPIEEFKKLFPEGEYIFEGRQIDGVKMRSTFELTHDFPTGPQIVSPVEDEVVAPDGLVVEWQPGDQPPGVEIVGYRVVVPYEAEPERDLMLELPADARSVPIPAEFLSVPGEYKAEVLAIERSGNQTLTEVPFVVE